MVINCDQLEGTVPELVITSLHPANSTRSMPNSPSSQHITLIQAAKLSELTQKDIFKEMDSKETGESEYTGSSSHNVNTLRLPATYSNMSNNNANSPITPQISPASSVSFQIPEAKSIYPHTSSIDHSKQTKLEPPTRPFLNRYHSLPLDSMSPLRQQFRLHSPVPHRVKETSSVSFLEDARGRFINQYQITSILGRGSFGMVYLAVDPADQKYAIKECSKRQLAKLNRSEFMKLRRQIVTRGLGHVTTDELSSLINREIAVMKKLDHPNLVTLYEVLDHPDSEYMILVIEWCPGGTIMPAEEDYNGNAQPIPESQCRLYFRDIILGVEYLHARGICHRDIKADNVLLGDNDVVKLADFGVSEIFDLTTSGDNVMRPVGSPAYMSPELVKLQRAVPSSENMQSANAPISGRRADIWAMGCTLYYMVHGRLPFEASNLVELHHKILSNEPDLSQCSPQLADLFEKIFEKNPANRITISEMRNHPWVTQSGLDMLLPVEENIQVSEDDKITEDDLLDAIELIVHREGNLELDYNSIYRSLRINHGWHGPTESVALVSGSRTPRLPDTIDCNSSNSNSPHCLSNKMEKLSRALEEMLRVTDVSRRSIE